MTARRVVRSLGVLAAVVVPAVLVGGALGVPVALALLVACRVEGVVRTGRHAAVAAAVCLGAAVLALVVEDPLADEPRFDFSEVRPVASNLGLMAGVLLLSSVSLAWVERVATGDRDPLGSGEAADRDPPPTGP